MVLTKTTRQPIVAETFNEQKDLGMDKDYVDKLYEICTNSTIFAG